MLFCCSSVQVTAEGAQVVKLGSFAISTLRTNMLICFQKAMISGEGLKQRSKGPFSSKHLIAHLYTPPPKKKKKEPGFETLGKVS